MESRVAINAKQLVTADRDFITLSNHWKKLVAMYYIALPMPRIRGGRLEK